MPSWDSVSHLSNPVSDQIVCAGRLKVISRVTLMCEVIIGKSNTWRVWPLTLTLDLLIIVHETQLGNDLVRYELSDRYEASYISL